MPQECCANEFARRNWIDNPALPIKSVPETEHRSLNDEPQRIQILRMEFSFHQTIQDHRVPSELNGRRCFYVGRLRRCVCESRVVLQRFFSNKRISTNSWGSAGIHTASALFFAVFFLDRLYEGKKPDDRLEPVPVGELSPEKKQQKLENKIKADRASNPVLEMRLSAEKYGV